MTRPAKLERGYFGGVLLGWPGVVAGEEDVVSPVEGVFTGGVADGATEELGLPGPEEGRALPGADEPAPAPVDAPDDVSDEAPEDAPEDVDVSAPAVEVALAALPVEAPPPSDACDHQSFLERCDGEAFKYELSSA
ncbi:MAG TPA: hypothetical protein VGC92_17005 [Phenylobacterium sp.]